MHIHKVKKYLLFQIIYENTGIGTNILIQKGAIVTTKPRQIIEAVKEKNKNGETEKSDTNKLGNPNDKSALIKIMRR